MKRQKVTIKNLKKAVIERMYDLVTSNKYLSEVDMKLLEMLLKKRLDSVSI